ncbi:MAG: FkbM family methyltransferase [Nanoarchaeota archaeon]
MEPQTKMSLEELKIFNSLSDLKVVFDVGTRIDTNYIDLKPEAEYHLFEPNPEFFYELRKKINKKNKVFLNNYGLGSKEDKLSYNLGMQKFMEDGSSMVLPIKTLDWYMNDKGIEKIDFLKIDTEGMDYEVLQGGYYSIKKTRYIQYEHWNDRLCFHDILDNDFILCYLGGRNVFCIRRGERWPNSLIL